ncbi:hypothetical protein [Halovenus salina]|uniref:hypothetical protein n=1 Tax=Halovenus salina TaxID=1510225 RepID=UPI002260C3ED|nr:hypothetical protein [Halovenus salina]
MKRLVVAALVITALLVGFPMMGSANGVATDASETATYFEDVSGPTGVALQVNDTDGGDNETERHRNPDDRDGNGDEEAVLSWLSGRLAGKLGDGAIQISDEQYELARDILGDDYDDRLEQFVDVSGGSDETDTFREAGDKEEELVDLREEFEETRAAYEEAVENGNTERARELARKLVALAEQIEDVSADLEALLAEIESISGEDLSDARAAIEQVQNESISEATEIAEREFESTELSVDIATERISFLDPAVLTGQIQTVEGEPLANEEIQLTVGNESHTVETGPDGAFSLEHRPTDLPLSAETLSISYVPEPNSVYLGSEASVPVTVTQVEPTMDIRVATETVGYGDTVTISGNLSVENVPVSGVPLSVTLGGREINTIQVTDGSFESAVEIPANVPAGEQELTVSLPFENQALAGVTETQAVTVEETETALSVTASQVNGTALSVSGTVTTVDGLGVGGQSVEITLDGERVGTVMTRADGSFATTLAITPDEDGEEVQIGAAFDGTASNLRSSQGDTIVTLELPANPGGSGSAAKGDTSPIDTIEKNVLLPGTVLGSGVLLLMLGAVWWYRRPNNEDTTTDDGTVRDEGAVGGREANVLDSLFDHATTHLESGDANSAVQASYSAVRRQFEATIDAGRALTHWEFYQAYRNASDGADEESASETTEDALRALTEAYEQAAYSPDGVQIEEATRTVERARQLCTRADGGTAAADSDSVRADSGGEPRERGSDR